MKVNAVLLIAPLVSMGAALPHVHQRANNANGAQCEAVAATTSSTSTCSLVTTTIFTSGTVTSTSTSATPTAAGAEAAAGNNIQKFTGALGGPPPPVASTAGNRPFSVNGNTFVGAGAALGRSCDIQHNACANAANSGKLAGGIGQCETQLTACRAANGQKKKRSSNHNEKRALDLGTCSDATILFKDGLDGRTQPAFIAANQKDFNHGSALGIGIIAGFICQRLGSSCKAPADVQTSCSQASAAAVAAPQNQAAADAFNAIMGGGGAAAPASPAPTAGVSATSTSTTAAAKQTGNGNGKGKGSSNNNNNQECNAQPPTTPTPATPTFTPVVTVLTKCS